MTHIAIDLGSTNKNSEAVLFTPDSMKTRHISFKTTRQNIRTVVQEQKVTTVIVEMCRTAHWVHQELAALGLTVLIANTNTDAFRLAGRRTKTDRTDAQRLRQLYLTGDLKTVRLLSEESRARRHLLDIRNGAVRQRSAIKSSIRHLLDTVCLTLPNGKSGWTKQAISTLHSWCDQAPEGTPAGPWQEHLAELLTIYAMYHSEVQRLDKKVQALNEASENAQHLRLIPGIGVCISVAVAASIDDPLRFRHAKQVSKYSGFHPVPYESGKMKRCQGISRMSWSLLRGYLVEACCIGIFKQKDPWMTLQYERVFAKSSCKKKALCAVARRLYIKCWQMLRTGQTWVSVTRDSLEKSARPIST